VIAKILFMCRKEKYSLVSDFAWYTSVLLELAVMPGSRHGAEVADQLIEVALRVDTVRPYAVETMLRMLLNEQLVMGHARATVSEVLKAAAWVVGEYCEIVSRISRDRSDSLDEEEAEAEEDDLFWIEGANGDEMRSSWRGQKVHLLVMEALLHPRATNLPQHVQQVYLQAALKVFVRASADCDQSDLADIVGIARQRLTVFMQVFRWQFPWKVIWSSSLILLTGVCNGCRVKTWKCKSAPPPSDRFWLSWTYCRSTGSSPRRRSAARRPAPRRSLRTAVAGRAGSTRRSAS
jgi:hypothetical protein